MVYELARGVRIDRRDEVPKLDYVAEEVVVEPDAYPAPDERRTQVKPTSTERSVIISSVEQPRVKLSGAIEGTYVVEERRPDGRLLVAPDTSGAAIMERLGHEPAALAEFEAAYGAVKPPDGEG
jgi:hypothetical protein